MRAATVVVLLATLALGFQLHKAGLATGFVDPVGRVRAQDEAVYAHSAIRMARSGHWLTPSFMGRHALYKPPLLFWLAGPSVRLFGVSPLSLRLPSLLAAALAATLLFLWLRSSTSLFAAVAASILLISSPLFHRVSRMCLTDALLALFLIAGLSVLHRDPRLTRQSSLWLFATFSAAAILTKGVAGLLPLLILSLFALLNRRAEHPCWRHLLHAWLLAGALAAPWHLYQVLIHPRWFWAEYAVGEIFTFGLASPYQTSAEFHPLFYLHRLFLTDPFLCVLVLTAVPAFISAWRRRHSHLPRLLLSWAAVVSAAMLLFQYRNASYLSLLLPALALIAVAYGPLLSGRRAALSAGAFGLLFFARTAFPDRPWGLDFRAGTTVEAAPLLDAYARMHRPSELILVSPDDEFYSAVLPLPRVRYCLIDPRDYVPAHGIDFRHLGINVTIAQFLELDRWRPIFHQRLRAWNLDSDEPLATVIVAGSPVELATLLAASPQTDFFLPTSLRSTVAETAESTHRLLPVSASHFFLLARP